MKKRVLMSLVLLTMAGTGIVFAQAEKFPYLAFTLVSDGSGYQVAAKGNTWDLKGDVKIPDVFDNKPVVAIAPKGFQNRGYMTGVTIPKKVTKIPVDAFNGSGITSIIIPSSITEIGNSAFAGCTKLVKVTMGNNVTTIGPNAFKGCKELNELAGASIGNNVVTIGSSAFEGCTSLEKVFIRKNVQSIEDSAFKGCERLIRVNFERAGRTTATIAIANNAFPGNLSAIYQAEGPGPFDSVLKSGKIDTWARGK